MSAENGQGNAKLFPPLQARESASVSAVSVVVVGLDQYIVGEERLG
jgi:hypothetical protein